jgi:hypothetical protein
VISRCCQTAADARFATLFCWLHRFLSSSHLYRPVAQRILAALLGKLYKSGHDDG